MRAEILNTRTAGIGSNTLTTFTLLLVIPTQRYVCSLDKVGCMPKLSQQSFCHWWQNIHYHLTNLQNHITTNIFAKQQIFSVRSSPDPPIFKKIAVRSSPVQAKIGFSPDPLRSSPHPCSSLWCTRSGFGIQSGLVLNIFWIEYRLRFNWIRNRIIQLKKLWPCKKTWYGKIVVSRNITIFGNHISNNLLF